MGLFVHLDIETRSTKRRRRGKAAHAGSGDGEGAFVQRTHTAHNGHI
jgi:hypothetical protein